MSCFDMNLFHSPVPYYHFLSCINIPYFFLFKFPHGLCIFINSAFLHVCNFISCHPSMLFPQLTDLFSYFKLLSGDNPISSVHVFKLQWDTNDLKVYRFTDLGYRVKWRYKHLWLTAESMVLWNMDSCKSLSRQRRVQAINKINVVHYLFLNSPANSMWSPKIKRQELRPDMLLIYPFLDLLNLFIYEEETHLLIVWILIISCLLTDINRNGI